MKRLLVVMFYLFLVASLILSACGSDGDKSFHGNKENASRQDKSTICHKSDDDSYIELSLPKNAMKGHSKHNGDIIPAPVEGCPK